MNSVLDEKGNCLLLWRGTHPIFSDDPDLPGGTVETGETALEAALREVVEEVGVGIESESVTELYAGRKYSKHLSKYYLYSVELPHGPTIALSWEHTSYKWLSHQDFLEELKTPKDTYMQMVRDVVASRDSPLTQATRKVRRADHK